MVMATSSEKRGPSMSTMSSMSNNSASASAAVSPAEPPPPSQVGREFVRQYYTLLNHSPLHLHRFYNDNSSFVHGGLDSSGGAQTEPVVGQHKIHERIMELNFRDCHAKIRQVDANSTIGNGVVVQVSGELSNSGQPMRRFMQTFVLAPQSAKQYYVHNDIFRYQDDVFDDEEPPQPQVQAQQVPPQQVQQVQQVQAPPPQTVQPQVPPQKSNGAATAQQETQASPVQQQLPQQQQQQQQQQAEDNNHAVGGGPPKPEAPEENGNSKLPQQQQQPVVSEKPAPVAKEAPAPPSDVTSPLSSASSTASSSTTNEIPVVSAAPEQEKPAPTPAAPGAVLSYANLVKSKPAAPAPTPAAPGSNAPVVSVAPKDGAGKEKGFAGRRSTGPAAQDDGTKDDGAGSVSGLPPSGRGGRAGPGGRGGLAPRPAPNAGEGSGPMNIGYPDSQQVFVGNLPHDCTDDELKALFSQWGTVVDIRINSRAAAQAKTTLGGARVPNFGFIVFDSDQATQKCLASKPIFLEDVPYKGGTQRHRLNVEEKKMKPNEGRGSLRRERGDYDGGRPEHARGADRARGGGGGMRGAPRGGKGGPQPPFPRKKSPYPNSNSLQGANNA